jgi:hypothetical protein
VVRGVAARQRPQLSARRALVRSGGAADQVGRALAGVALERAQDLAESWRLWDAELLVQRRLAQVRRYDERGERARGQRPREADRDAGPRPDARS